MKLHHWIILIIILGIIAYLVTGDSLVPLLIGALGFGKVTANVTQEKDKLLVEKENKLKEGIASDNKKLKDLEENGAQDLTPEKEKDYWDKQ